MKTGIKLLFSINDKIIRGVIISLFFATLAYVETLSVSFESGYSSNVFSGEGEKKAAFPIILTSDVDYGYLFRSHRPGLSGDMGYGRFNGEDRQNYFTYGIFPYYEFEKRKTSKLRVSYGLFRNGAETVSSAHSYRHWKGTEVRASGEFESVDEIFKLKVSGSRKETREEDRELDYLDGSMSGIGFELEFFLYPESSLIFSSKYDVVAYNDSPVSSSRENDYNLVEGAFGWASTISKSVILKIMFLERYFRHGDFEKKFAGGFTLSVKTVLSPMLRLGTGFLWLTDAGRSLDARFLEEKGLNFLIDFILGPGLRFSGELGYRLVSYSEPHERNELNFIFRTGLEMDLFSNLTAFASYDFDVVEADAKGYNVYGEEELRSLKRHKILLGLKYSY